MPIVVVLDKKTTFIYVNMVLAVLSVAFLAQPESAITCLMMLMSFIPAGVAVVAMTVCRFYPLTTDRIKQINSELVEMRNNQK